MGSPGRMIWGRAVPEVIAYARPPDEGGVMDEGKIGAGHAAAHDVVRDGLPVEPPDDDRQGRAQALATGDDQVRRDLGEVGVGGDHRRPHRGLDPLAIRVHPRQRQQRRRRSSWHGLQASCSGRWPPLWAPPLNFLQAIVKVSVL